MKQVNYIFSFTHVPNVMKRGQHALVALIDNENRVYLGSKRIYPKGIYRLIGGGIDSHEDPKDGAIREVQEEVGIDLAPTDLTEVAQIDARFTETSTNKIYAFTTYLYSAHIGDEQLHPADDLDDVIALTQDQFKELIDYYRKLKDELINLGEKDGKKAEFRWSDYGKFYANVHEIVLNECF